jgi:hypothetical protein
VPEFVYISINVDIFSEFLPAERTEQMEWTDTLKNHLLKEGMTTPTVIQVSF